MAIDDIIVHEGQCVTTDLCDFESGSCAYNNDPLADFNWEIGNGTYLYTLTGLSLVDVNIKILFKK